MSTDTGAPWSLPIPENSDSPLGPTELGDLASSIDSALGRAYPCTSGTRPAQQVGLLIYETDTDTLRVSTGTSWKVVWRDSGAVTSGFTIQSGWTDVDSYYRLLGSLCYVHIQCNRSGSDLTFGSTSGGLSDPGIIAVPSAALNTRNSFYSVDGGVNIGGTYGGSFRVQSSTGIVQLISGNAAVTITSGNTVSVDYIVVPD